MAACQQEVNKQSFSSCMPLAPNVSARANGAAQLLSRLICTGMCVLKEGGEALSYVPEQKAQEGPLWIRHT